MLILASLLGCASPRAIGAVPAVLVGPSAATRGELLAAVQSALHNKTITLSRTALTTDSLLIIERDPQRGMKGRIATGRTLEMPERFRLLLDNGRCVLVHLRTGARYPLTGANCVPE